MKSLRFFIMALLCAVANVAWGADTWVKTSINDLNSNDIIVIVDQNLSMAMSNSNGTANAPDAISVTLSDDKTQIISSVSDNLQWRYIKEQNNFKFQVPTSSDPYSYLYINTNAPSGSNNCVRVGPSVTSSPTTNNNKFVIAQDNNGNDFLKSDQTNSRYVGVYKPTSGTIDWRGYRDINTNISNTRIAFYKKENNENVVSTPTFSPAAGTYTTAQDVTISCETTGATIHYTTDGSVPTASSPTYSSAIPVSTTTTIKAIAVKNGMTNSSVATATYTITTSYHLVTDASELFNDDVILIANQDAAKAMGGQNNNNRSAVAVDVNIQNQTINLDVANEVVQRITLQRSDNNFYFNVGNDGYLYAASSDNNYLRTETVADDNARATISLTSEGIASVKFQGTNTRNVMQYNPQNSIFACYGSASQQPIYIYKQVKDPEQFKLTIDSRSTDGKKNYYATISNLGSGNYVVPAGVKLSTITINNKKIVKTQTWEENDVISGNGAYYVVAAGIDDTNALTFNFAPTTNAVTKAPGTNWLHPAIANVPTAAPGEGSYRFYKLTLDADNTPNSVGFYWGGDNGVAFSFKTTHKAYLAIPQDSNSAGLSSIEIDDTTGINVIQSNTEQNDEVYTLSGVRVKGNLPKGIYIVNGKKQIVK